MIEDGAAVRELGREDVSEVVDLLCESFFDYPVMRFVLGGGEGYEKRLETLVHFFVMARVLRGEVMLGIGDPGTLSAAALVSRPSGSASPPELADLREKVWAELGTSARSRYEAFGAACAAFDVDVPHIHLNMLGVRGRAQGGGLGGRLIQYVHAMSGADPESEGVSLTTEDEANVSLYEHSGYRVVGSTTVAPELKTWGFFRPD